MTQEHPITPPPELVMLWSTAKARDQSVIDNWVNIATRAAQWGADQARRPALKEQALALLDDASDRLDAVHENAIRRALEKLPD